MLSTIFDRLHTQDNIDSSYSEAIPKLSKPDFVDNTISAQTESCSLIEMLD